MAALDAATAGSALPSCWAPLFAARSDSHIAPIRFALAGMNAHIDHDLALALMSTCAGQGTTPDTGSAVHRDFVKVNATLATVEAQVKADYLTGLVGVADDVLGRIDDVVAIGNPRPGLEDRSEIWTRTHARLPNPYFPCKKAVF